LVKIIADIVVAFGAMLILGMVARSYVAYHVRHEVGDKTGYMACVFVFSLIAIAAVAGVCLGVIAIA